MRGKREHERTGRFTLTLHREFAVRLFKLVIRATKTPLRLVVAIPSTVGVPLTLQVTVARTPTMPFPGKLPVVEQAKVPLTCIPSTVWPFMANAWAAGRPVAMAKSIRARREVVGEAMELSFLG